MAGLIPLRYGRRGIVGNAGGALSDSEHFRSGQGLFGLPAAGLAVGGPARPGQWGGSMMSDVRRREFITLLGGAAAAWPLAARAQQGERMRRVAFLHPYTENDPEVLARVVAFRQGLEALGWTENRNIRIEHRY